MSELWYTRPAASFFQALPVGNGSIGAMVYGRVGGDKITLNADTLWSGYAQDKHYPQAYGGYLSALNAMREGDTAAAEQAIWRDLLAPLKECYQPGGTLTVALDGLSENAHGYRRSLTLDTAEAETVYTVNGITVRQTVFCSYPAQVLAVRYTASAPVSGRAALTSPHLCRIRACDDALLLEGNAPYYAALRGSEEAEPIRYDPLGQNRTLSFAIALCAASADSRITVTDGAIRFSGCRALTLYLHIGTNFAGWNVPPAQSPVDPSAAALSFVRRAAAQDYAALRAAHIRDHGALFSRVALHFDGKDRTDLPTDERLRAYVTEKDDVGLVTLLFDYGRYLSIAAARPGSRPANLQGIWNEERQAPWSSNYTLNINYPMNDWLNDLCGLPECHRPFADFVCDLAESGSKIAGEYYHARGWCAHSNTDLWCQAQPNGGEGTPDAVRYAFFYMGGAWAATHLFRHYLYTQDRDYLARVFDTICGAAAFVSDMLVQNKDGQWQTAMSTSPENEFLLGGEPHALAETTALDLALTDELFGQCIEACRILGRRPELAAELTEKRTHLRPIGIGADGRILEWDKERPEADPHHRHVSHLYGAFPGHALDMIDERTRRAVERSLDARGIEGTGWSLCWKMSLWARARRPDMVEQCIDYMLRPVETDEICYEGGGGVYQNLLAAHPPFQIDANFGFVTAVVQMLLQEQNGEPVLLPALPARFSGGSVRGLCLPGGRTVDLTWKDGRIIAQHITAPAALCAATV